VTFVVEPRLLLLLLLLLLLIKEGLCSDRG
jgi:hypothetical protein